MRETDENRKRAIRREKEAEKKNKRERGRLEGNMKDSERTWSVGVCVCVCVCYPMAAQALTCMLKISSELSDWPVMLLTSLEACDDSEDEE